MNFKRITSKGFTLSELLTTLAVMGVVAAFAIPSFIGLIAENRLTTNANQLLSALAFVRSEAIKRGHQVTMRHKGTTERVWEEGWEIFTDANGNGVMDTSDQLLKNTEALPEGYTLRTGGTYAYWVAYLPNGKSDGAALGHDTFRLCDTTEAVTNSRAIIINKVGRVRIQKEAPRCP